jgi:hypothetical protein
MTRIDYRTASSLASSLPLFRVLLLVGGALAMSHALPLAAALFAAAFVSFAATLALGVRVYRESRAQRPEVIAASR